MEVQLCKAKISTVTGFVVVFLISIGSSVQASACGRTGCTDKYIVESYLDKYDSFIEQNFDNFIANEIPLSLSESNVSPTLSGLQRCLLGEGSHRRLSSSIRCKLKPVVGAHSCEVIIIESLPSGVFADPFELQHLVQRGVFKDAAVFGDTNLELPSFRSNRSVVELHMTILMSDDLEVNVEIPLHARYQPLGHGFSRVEFGKPDLLICCSSLEENTLVLMPINHNKTDPVIWEIPCGIKEHARVVSAVTFGFAVASALVIVLTSIHSRGSNKLKQV